MRRDLFCQPTVLQTPSSLALNASREGTPTASLGSPCQDLTTLTMKKGRSRIPAIGAGWRGGSRRHGSVCDPADIDCSAADQQRERCKADLALPGGESEPRWLNQLSAVGGGNPDPSLGVRS